MWSMPVGAGENRTRTSVEVMGARQCTGALAGRRRELYVARPVRRSTAVALAALFAVATAACSGDDDNDDTAGGASSTTASTAAAEPAVRVATFNVLHGLFCGAETDFCQAPDRATMLADALEDAGCPELVGLQEVGARQEATFPAAFERVCDGRYTIRWNPTNSPDREMVLTTLDVVDEGYLDLANFPWEAYWVRVQTDAGPVEFLTAHFASSTNDPPCDATRCPPVCRAGISTNHCNALEVVRFFDQRAEPAAISVVAGDLNATVEEPTMVSLSEAGFADAWVGSGNAECDASTGDGCTSDRDRPENPLDGLDVATGRYSERIDYVLTRGGADCEPRVLRAEVLAGEPVAEPFNGLYWPSDHAGVVADLACA
jgi:hypothetical protein